MKYSGYIDIDRPREIVAAFFAKIENQKKWQDGYLKREIVKGMDREKGAISKFYYEFGNRNMILTETVTANRLPDSFEATYHHKHMDNTWKCRFIALNNKSTRYEYEFEYTRISWVIPKLMAMLFPGMYRKQGEKWMKQFKQAIERL